MLNKETHILLKKFECVLLHFFLFLVFLGHWVPYFPNMCSMVELKFFRK
jgi:hypothetical protein